MGTRHSSPSSGSCCRRRRPASRAPPPRPVRRRAAPSSSAGLQAHRHVDAPGARPAPFQPSRSHADRDGGRASSLRRDFGRENESRPARPSRMDPAIPEIPPALHAATAGPPATARRRRRRPRVGVPAGLQAVPSSAALRIRFPPVVTRHDQRALVNGVARRRPAVRHPGHRSLTDRREVHCRAGRPHHPRRAASRRARQLRDTGPLRCRLATRRADIHRAMLPRAAAIVDAVVAILRMLRRRSSRALPRPPQPGPGSSVPSRQGRRLFDTPAQIRTGAMGRRLRRRPRDPRVRDHRHAASRPSRCDPQRRWRAASVCWRHGVCLPWKRRAGRNAPRTTPEST